MLKTAPQAWPGVLARQGVGHTSCAGAYLYLAGADIKFFQDVYQEVLNFNPRIYAVWSIQDYDYVHVSLASCEKHTACYWKDLVNALKGEIYSFIFHSQVLALMICLEKKKKKGLISIIPEDPSALIRERSHKHPVCWGKTG